MDKNGNLTRNSPCGYCGQTSVVVRNGIPVCVLHNRDPKELAMPECVQKVAETLSTNPPVDPAQ